MRWLIQLRWVAMFFALDGTLGAMLGMLPGAAWQVTGATAIVGCTYNFILHRRYIRDRAVPGRNTMLVQALVDLLMLTVLLWAVGGAESPFMGFYIFHVALIAIFGGPKWTVVAVAAACACAGFLVLPMYVPALQIGTWNPVEPMAGISEAAAFVATVSGAAYIVANAARELRSRESALARARDRAALEYRLLSNTLNELEAGLEVVDPQGRVLWRNRRAALLAPFAAVGEPWECPGERRPCEHDTRGICPVAAARTMGEPGRCRFAAPIEGDVERVYEMMVFPIDEDRDGEQPRVMNLYVDRTAATLAERQLLLAERLASLGRVAQGVAHELNTPLATIRTLATDMRQALRQLTSADSEEVADLDESATLIRDETRRLGRITQALLAGGDLVRAHIDGVVPLSSAVERARAIVFAGVRAGVTMEVEDLTTIDVAADMDRLVQVLVNLLQNAVDAVRSHNGSMVRILVEEGDDGVRILVDDDGPGIDTTIINRLFEPFATTKPPGEGTGLGLYTSYMLVQEMGGTLSLENREAGGARACIHLPTTMVAAHVPTARLIGTR